MERIGHYDRRQARPGRVGSHAAPSSTRRPASRRTRSTSPTSTRSTPPSMRLREAFPAWRATSLSKRVRDHVPGPRAAGRPQGRRRRRHHRAARQGALGRDGRGRSAASRTSSSRLRHPEPAEGRLQRAGLDGRRRLLDPPAARRGRGHHPVQLPGDGAAVDVRERDRVRQHVRAQALGEGPGRVARARRAAPGRGRARRRVQRRPGRQGGRRPDPRAPRHPRGELRRLDADRALHLRDTGRGTGSGCRRSAARRTT